MISAVAKLKSIKKLKEMAFFLSLLVLTGFWAAVLVAPSADAVELKSADQSFARIVISKADYLRGKQAGASDYVTLPEIARQAMYRSFGKTNSELGDAWRRPYIKTDGGTSSKGSPWERGNTDDGTNSQGSPWERGRPARSENTDSISSLLDGKKVDVKFLKPAGVFVTLSKSGKTRACWGSVYPRESSIARETVLATLGALSKEYRFKKISSIELKNLKVQVTVIRGIEPVSNIKEVNPFKDGVMVRAGGRGGVILPGEAVDAYYELVLAKLKAGIKPEEPCQIYKLKAEIYD